MSFLGDYTVGDTINFKFTSRQFSTGAPFTLAGTPSLAIYEDESVTQITAGITLTADFDAVTGLNHVTIVASGANGFEAGKDYDVVIAVGTVDSVSVVGEVVGRFTLGRSAAAVDLANGTDGLGAIKAETASILTDTAEIGAAGAGLTAVPWNAAWDAEVQSEVDDALVAQRLDELLNADSDIDGAAPPTVGSVFHELMTKTAGSFTYDQTTDSLEAVRDRGDAAWITATGFSTHTAADVWTAVTRTLTAGTNIQLPSNGLANVTAWTVNITGDLSGSVGSVTTKTGYALTADYDFAKGTVAMTESYAANAAAPTPVQALFAIHQDMMQFSIASTSKTVKQLDNTTTAFVVTLNSATAPSSAVRT